MLALSTRFHVLNTGNVPGCSYNESVYDSDSGVPRCPQDNALVMVLYAIYVLLTNILLINLLIAMFR